MTLRSKQMQDCHRSGAHQNHNMLCSEIVADDQHRWKQATDEEIVKQVQSGATWLFDVLVDRYRRWLVATVLRIVGDSDDAEDIVQIACVKAYIHLDNYEGRAPFRVWVHRIAVFQALTYKRASQRYCRIEEYHLGVHTITPEVQYGSMERNAALNTAINCLTPRERRVLTMFHLEELSANEIACSMGVTPLKVRVWLFRARQKLRRKLDRYHCPPSS
jgi:RNA polymerase sigma factor (sigma-70 family)